MERDIDNFFAELEDSMAKKKNYKTKRIEPQVYIGPTLPGGALSANTVFRNGLPAHVEQLKQEDPQIGRLIVPVSELSTARQHLSGHGRIAQAYRHIVKNYFG